MARHKGMSHGSFAAFPNTPWTLVRDAQTFSHDRRAWALNELVRRYWKPIYSYYRAKGQSRHDAEDLVQGFLCRFLDKESIMHVDQSNSGRFRDFLIASARNYLIDVIRRAKAQRRLPPEGIISIEVFKHSDGPAFEPASGDTPEEAFNDGYGRSIVHRALKSVRQLCADRSRLADFQIFVERHLCEREDRPTWEQLARQHDLENWKKAFNKADWVMKQFSLAIRDEDDDIAAILK